MIPFDLRVFFNNHPTKIPQKNHQQPFQKTYLHLLTCGMTVILPLPFSKKCTVISPSCSSFHRSPVSPVSLLHSPRRLLRCRSAQRLCKGRCSFSLRKKTDGGGGPNFKGEEPIHLTVCRECSFFWRGFVGGNGK